MAVHRNHVDVVLVFGWMYDDDEDGWCYSLGMLMFVFTMGGMVMTRMVCYMVVVLWFVLWWSWGNRQEFAVEVVSSLVTSFSACDVWLVAC